jgi:hypothetical protein
MKRILLAIAIFLSLHTYTRATTITVFWPDEDIVIGADSKLILWGGTETKSVCKIGVLLDRSMLWAAAGILTLGNNVSPVAEIVDEVMSQPLTVTEAFDRVTDALQNFISGSVNAHRQQQPGRPVITQIVFGYFYGSKPAIDFIQAAANPPDYAVKTVRVHCPSNDSNCVGERLIFGETEVIHAELADNPKIIRQLGIKGAIEHFIAEESAVHPIDVGPPAAIVRLTNSRAEWIEKGECDNPPERYACDNASDPACPSPK